MRDHHLPHCIRNSYPSCCSEAVLHGRDNVISRTVVIVSLVTVGSSPSSLSRTALYRLWKFFGAFRLQPIGCSFRRFNLPPCGTKTGRLKRRKEHPIVCSRKRRKTDDSEWTRRVLKFPPLDLQCVIDHHHSKIQMDTPWLPCSHSEPTLCRENVFDVLLLLLSTTFMIPNHH